MSFRLDYSEPLTRVVSRLKDEHREFREMYLRVKSTNDLKVAISLLILFRAEILRHAVEEEARLVRAIFQGSKAESRESIEIMQQHRRVMEFLNDKLPYLKDIPEEKAKKEIEDFLVELQKHNEEEERVVFPLALKSRSS